METHQKANEFEHVAGRQRASIRVKRGLAEMLRGGVIMDVVTADQAKIAEDAGAVAVMALERVPADIRRDGGVARMSDPILIEGIQGAVTIPVMAKARIGHFAEAQVLEALRVDYIDESEVLTPADEEYHIDKWAFQVPFVCGATNLGEALRRISEGAALIRSKGEAGTGNVVEAVRHVRSILGDIRKLTTADSAERYGWAKRLQAPIDLVEEVAANRSASGAAVLRRRPGDAGRRRTRHATRGRSGLRRFRDLQEFGRSREGPCHRGGDGALRGAGDRGQGIEGSWRGHARRGNRDARGQARRPRLVTRVAGMQPAARAVSGATGPKVGVLALQGDVREHVVALESCGAVPVAVRKPEDLDGIRALVFPGGESTTMSLLLKSSGLARRACSEARGWPPRPRDVCRDDPAR